MCKCPVSRVRVCGIGTMGKKQQKQQQPQQAGAKPAQEAKPEKKAKGHRQKGAGTVITAREPIVRDGIEVQVRL